MLPGATSALKGRQTGTWGAPEEPCRYVHWIKGRSEGAKQPAPKANIAGSRCLRGWLALFEREGKMKEVKCRLCSEKLIAPEWSEYTNAHEVQNVWHCTNCGYVFESLDRKAPPPFALAEQFLPSLIIT
jgi:hypothetical protein